MLGGGGGGGDVDKLSHCLLMSHRVTPCKTGSHCIPD